MTSPDQPLDGAGRPLRVVVVTPDLLGPVRNGGVGTACSTLALGLAALGHEVSVLFTQVGTRLHATDPVFATYASARVAVSVLAEEVEGVRTIHPSHPDSVMSYRVYQHLRSTDSDAIYFMDWHGHGYHSLIAKRAGIAFGQTALLVVAHGVTIWHELGNAISNLDSDSSIPLFLERRSIALADSLISPSDYMLEWLTNHRFELPESTKRLPNLPPATPLPTVRHRDPRRNDRFAFFGRLEFRKGLVQFCDALDLLEREGSRPALVEFIGKFGWVGSVHSAAYLAQRMTAWTFPVEFRPRLSQPEALGHLAREGLVAVAPSVEENLPYTVYECLLLGLPILARQVGGTAELLPPGHEGVLFDGSPRSLADAMRRTMDGGAPSSRLRFDAARVAARWDDHLRALVLREQRSSVQRSVSIIAGPKVSVCLVHHERPSLLRQAVRSLIDQTYQHLEVVLVDDGSESKDAREVLDELSSTFSDRGWKIIRSPRNSYVGEARNLAAREASGESLVFMDDDNVAQAHMVETMVRASLLSGCEIVTCAFDVFSGSAHPDDGVDLLERYVPLGASLAMATRDNLIGDANFLIDADLFARLGGFTTDYGVGNEDHEFLITAVLGGHQVLPIPEALFWYRRGTASMLTRTLRGANRARSLRAFARSLDPALAELAFMTEPERPAVASAPTVWHDALGIPLLTLQLSDPDDADVLVEVIELSVLSGVTSAPTFSIGSLSARSENYIAQLSAGIEVMGGGGGAASIARWLGGIEQLPRRQRARLALLALAVAARQTPALILSPRTWTTISSMALDKPANRVATLLALSEFCCNSGSNSDAWGYFAEALVQADASYVSRREDLTDAISDRDLVSGLEHFVLYGRTEGADWPQLAWFRRVAAILE